MVSELHRLKINRIRDYADKHEPTSLIARARKRYGELSAQHSQAVVWVHLLHRFTARLRGKLAQKFSRRSGRNLTGLAGSLNDTKLAEAFNDLVPHSTETSHRLIYAIRITGGLGDALVIARMARDLQAMLGNDLLFDVYYQSPKIIEPFFQMVPGFRKSIDIEVFQDTARYYAFSLLTNQFVIFMNEHIDHRALLRHHPDILNLYGHIQSQRANLKRYITHHPFLDAAFADIATKQGHKRYTYLHQMLGIPYGGDRLALEVDTTIITDLGLQAKQYITIHDGWDTKFKLAVHRPTKAIPRQTWSDIVAALKIARPDLQIVQLGGKTGDDISRVDLNLKNQLSFAQSTSVLSGSALHIDSESGLVHLGAALGIRSVVMFGPTNIDWFGYPQNANIAPKHCGNCWWSSDTWMDSCPLGHKIPVCTANIDVDEVIKETLRLLNETSIANDLGAIPVIANQNIAG